jgi:hypothetical protein
MLCQYASADNSTVHLIDQNGADRIVPATFTGDFRLSNGVADVLAAVGKQTPDPFVAIKPSVNPADYPLTMRQLRQALLTFGGQPVDFVASVVAKIADPTQKALATIWYEETVTGINWSDPETQFLIAASGIPLAQASALWLKAASL